MSRKNGLSVFLLLMAVVLLAVNLRSPLISFGPLVGMIRSDLAISGTWVGVIGALPTVAFALCAPVAVRLARRFGMENVLVVSIVLMMMGILVRSMLPSVGLLTLGTVLLAAAIAMSNVLLPALAKRNLPDRVGLVVGALSASMSVSSAIAAAVAVPMAMRWGWQNALAVWLITAFLALLVWLRVRRCSTVVADEQIDDTVDDVVALRPWQSLEAWGISVFMGIQSAAFYIMVNFLPSVLVEKGLTDVQAGVLASLFQVTSLLGGVGISMVFGNSHHKQMWNMSLTMLMLLGVMGLWLGTAQWLLWASIALLGMGGAGTFSIVMMLFALRTRNAQDAAALSGMAQTVGYAVAALGPLGMGMMYDVWRSWSAPMGILAAVVAVGCGVAWFAAKPEWVR